MAAEAVEVVGEVTLLVTSVPAPSPPLGSGVKEGVSGSTTLLRLTGKTLSRAWLLPLPSAVECLELVASSLLLTVRLGLPTKG